jgi:dihydrofolate synthase/folylpolyglutamate synthase
MTKSFKQWLEHIESFHPEEIELGLERVKNVADELDVLRNDSRVIIVGGTNGKGSCVAMLEALALQSSLTVGCYTSPHLINFNERIRINGSNVSDQLLVESFSRIETIRADTALTFFEFTTLAALDIFKQLNVDLIVLEVGLGGRLDAVNIATPDVSLITCIDYDHQSWLGNTLPEIAFEKAGIYRQSSVNLVGDTRSLEAILACNGNQVVVPELVDTSSLGEREIELAKIVNDTNINQYLLLMQNLRLACVGFSKLFSEQFKRLDLSETVTSLKLQGRFHRIQLKPLVILDVGHNVQAANNLVVQLQSLKSKGQIRLICGMMADKSTKAVIEALEPIVDSWCFVDLPIDRAAKASSLYQQYLSVDKKGSSKAANAICLPSPAAGYDKMLTGSEDGDVLLVFGSFITVAGVMQYLAEDSIS